MAMLVTPETHKTMDISTTKDTTMLTMNQMDSSSESIRKPMPMPTTNANISFDRDSLYWIHLKRESKTE
jgi:hypothetical protein